MVGGIAPSSDSNNLDQTERNTLNVSLNPSFGTSGDSVAACLPTNEYVPILSGKNARSEFHLKCLIIHMRSVVSRPGTPSPVPPPGASFHAVECAPVVVKGVRSTPSGHFAASFEARVNRSFKSLL